MEDSPLFDSIDGPLELVWDAFIEDDPNATLALQDLINVMDAMVLQTTADGRISVFMQEDKVTFTLQEIISTYFSYFDFDNYYDNFNIDFPISISIDNQPAAIYNIKEDFIIPENTTSVVVEFLGVINATATFVLISDPSQIPADVDYPLICLGFPAPDVIPSCVKQYIEFATNRNFPVTTYTPIVNHRVSLEKRNELFLHQQKKKMQKLKQRADEARKEIETRHKQYILLEENSESALSTTCTVPKRDNEEIEESLEKLITKISELATAVSDAEELLVKKRQPSIYTRKEELELLKRLKAEVTSDRERVEALGSTE